MKTSHSYRRDGIRQARRASNWTAAFLLALTAATAAEFGREGAAVTHGPGTARAVAAGSPAGQPAGGGPARTGVAAHGSAGKAKAAARPTVSHSVATTTPSGVTVTRTTRTVNGKSVVTQVRRGQAYGDN